MQRWKKYYLNFREDYGWEKSIWLFETLLLQEIQREANHYIDLLRTLPSWPPPESNMGWPLWSINAHGYSSTKEETKSNASKDPPYELNRPQKLNGFGI